MQRNNDHLLRGVKLADHIPGALKTLVPVAVSPVGEVRTVAKKKEHDTMLPPASFLLPVIIQNKKQQISALSVTLRLPQNWLL